MQKHERLIYIVNLLQNHNGLTSRVIADKCGVSMRTVYRDILTLSETGIPVYFDNGYRILDRVKMPTIELDDNELVLLSLAIKSSSMYSVESMKNNLNGIIDKLTINSHPQAIESSNRDDSIIAKSASSSINRIVNETIIENLEEAILGNRMCKLNYTDASGKQSERLVKPYSLVFRGRGFYLLAFCTFRNDYRLFHLDRIDEYQITEEVFIIDENFSVDQYFRYSWRVGGGVPQNIVIKFAPEAAQVIF